MRRYFLLTGGGLRRRWTIVHCVSWIIIVALCGSAWPVSAAETVYREAPGNVLFIGNSFTYYNNSLHNHYKALVQSSNYKYETKSVTRIMTISGGY